MSTHTPGPWKVFGRAGYTGHKVEDGKGRSVAAFPSTSKRSKEERDANAVLIAAAPELFAALKAAVEAHGPFGDDSRPSWWHDACIAISKAEGWPTTPSASYRARPVGSVRKASEIRIGDMIVGQFEVAEISHGPLDRQIRFRNADETATAFFREDEMLMIEVRS